MVTVVIPIKNSAGYLEACLRSIRSQTYKRIEIILVDSHSKDGTPALARKYRARISQFVPKIAAGTFEAPHKRNYGVRRAKGEFVYYVDADMELTKHVITDAVRQIRRGFDAVIVPEDSFGKGIWAQAKNLERRCYWGDDSIEAPRFFKKSVWIKVGGLDTTLGGGGDDWDLYQKILSKGYTVGRTKSIVLHNEGSLSLTKLIRKRFMYGRDSLKYVIKRPKAGMKSYFPIRKAYIRNWRLFISRPKDSFFFIIMRSAEYGAGFAGMVYSFLNK